MAKQPLIIATGNPHKIAEMHAQLEAWFDVRGLPPNYDEPEENGATFAANARIKAETAARRLNTICLADDSGLVVDALDGAPGIYSARYAGVHGDDEANNDKLLQALIAVPDAARSARFICALSLASPEGEIAAFEAAFEGKVGHERRGTNGFGYDPLFELPDGRTSAELPPAEKQRCSHRGVALAKLAEALKTTNLLARCVDRAPLSD